jgi:hypothetical protein
MSFDHLAILGMSYTGSTIVSYALGALPQCSNVDEAHWLVDDAAAAGRAPEFCCHCGPSCKIWTTEQRARLRASNTFYADVADVLGSEILVSADKDPQIYDRLEPGGDRRYLMLYRDPIAQSKSALKAAALEGSSTELRPFLNYWVDKNIELLARLAQHGGNRLLNLADFQANPTETIDKICRAYGLTYSADWETYWEKTHHSMGGNFNPFTYAQDGDLERLKIKTSPPSPHAPNDHEDSRRLLEFMDGHRMNLRLL